jgi:hypothetical protein
MQSQNTREPPTNNKKKKKKTFAEIALVGIALVEKLRDGKAAIHEHAGLAILGKDPVRGSESGGAAHVRRLLAKRRHVKRNPTLTLHLVQHVIHHVQRVHHTVHLHHSL